MARDGLVYAYYIGGEREDDEYICIYKSRYGIVAEFQRNKYANYTART